MPGDEHDWILPRNYKGWLAGVSLVVLAYVGVLQPTRIDVDVHSVRLRGAMLWGTRIALRDVALIRLESALPPIGAKRNGYEFLGRKWGDYEVEGLGPATLLLENDQPPFILVQSASGSQTVLTNLGSAAATQGTFRRIEQAATRAGAQFRKEP
jgi:hypothetical protein